MLPYMVSICICFVYLQAFCDFPPFFVRLKENKSSKKLAINLSFQILVQENKTYDIIYESTFHVIIKTNIV